MNNSSNTATVINYSWITTQPITPPSENIGLSASVYFQSSSLSFDALFPTQMHTRTRNHCEQRCVHRSLLFSGGCSSSPTESSMIMLRSRGTLLYCYYSPRCSPSSFLLTLCLTVCLCLSSYTSHCIWPCWLSHILHCFLSGCLLPNCQEEEEKKEAIWAA